MDDPQGPIGGRKETLDTPALLLDLAVMESNVARMAQRCRENGVGWRPHVKGIKVPAIAQYFIGAGALGVTCAKLGEAELMAAAGIRNILVANQIVGQAKLERLVKLAYAQVIVAVDHSKHVTMLAEAARQAGIRQPVVIEVDIGMARAGVAPGAATLALARAITGEPALRFAGLMAWEGQTARLADQADKQAAVRDAVGALVRTADLCRAEGIPVGIVSCGGTSTYGTTTAIAGVTEIQAGGGAFSDICTRMQYRIDHPFALTLLATVTSRPTPARIICDAGRKSMTGDIAMPQPVGLDGVRGIRLSAEHCTIDLDAPNHAIEIGDTIEFIVGHADTTVHLHEQIYGIRDGRIEAAWPVAARGVTH